MRRNFARCGQLFIALALTATITSAQSRELQSAARRQNFAYYYERFENWERVDYLIPAPGAEEFKFSMKRTQNETTFGFYYKPIRMPEHTMDQAIFLADGERFFYKPTEWLAWTKFSTVIPEVDLRRLARARSLELKVGELIITINEDSKKGILDLLSLESVR
jgi:hypothetical protein